MGVETPPTLVPLRSQSSSLLSSSRRTLAAAGSTRGTEASVLSKTRTTW